MAEKAAPKKRVVAKQQMLAAVTEAQKDVEERHDAELKPERRIEEKAVRRAVAIADELSVDAVLKSITELRTSVSGLLSPLGEKLEAELDKYVQIRKAIQAKEKELADIFEIQRSASTLTALIEAQQRLSEEFESRMAREREELQREIDATRQAWAIEKKGAEAEAKERDAAEQKRRQRDQEEFRYTFAREQQLAKEQSADEKARQERELTLRKQESERQLLEREQALTQREAELAELRRRVEAAPQEQEAAVARAVKQAVERCQADAAARHELIGKEFAGERGMLTTKIASLEQTTADQAKQLAALSQKLEKAYAQVQEVAVKAIEGSANAKWIGNLQQLLSEQTRKGTTERG